MEAEGAMEEPVVEAVAALDVVVAEEVDVVRSPAPPTTLRRNGRNSPTRTATALERNVIRKESKAAPSVLFRR